MVFGCKCAVYESRYSKEFVPVLTLFSTDLVPLIILKLFIAQCEIWLEMQIKKAKVTRGRVNVGASVLNGCV